MTKIQYIHTVAREEDYYDEVFEEMEEICISEIRTLLHEFRTKHSLNKKDVEYLFENMDYREHDPHYHFVYSITCPVSFIELLKEHLKKN